jgi:hypothetical protein
VVGLARTKPATSVHDAGWASFITMLQYKAERYGRTLVKTGRFEPASQTCSTCGVQDRDVNAAINVKTAAGLAVSACGAPVRPEPVLAQRQETGSHGSPTQPRAAQRHNNGTEGHNPRAPPRGASQARRLYTPFYTRPRTTPHVRPIQIRELMR